MEHIHVKRGRRVRLFFLRTSASGGALPSHDRCAGITLIELLVSVAVFAVVVASASPWFSTLQERTSLSTFTENLARDLALARSEAVRRELRVTLCKSADHASCTTAGDWSQGYIVFAETDSGNAAVDAGEPIIAVNEGGDVSVSGNGTIADYVSYHPTGRSVQVGSALLQTGTFTLTAGTYSKQIVISNTGRAWVKDV